MNNFVIDTPDNFWQIRWLDKYMEGHKGFIAGGCFKNILSGEKVKDIDIFFESESNLKEKVIFRKLLICSMMKNIRKKDGNLSIGMRRYAHSRKREKRYG